SSSASPTPNGPGAIPADGITVDVVSGPDIGLEFQAAWQVGPGQTQDSNISFTVSVIGGGPQLIEDAAVAQIASGGSGTGSVTVTEGGCGPAPCTPNAWSVFTFNTTTSVTTQTAADTLFTPVGSIQVDKDIGLAGGTNGVASLIFVEDTFSQTSVPEPASLAI